MAADQSTNDNAVSPVIGVILMVAITVVLAAVVFLWAGQFQAEDTTPGTLALSSNGAETSEHVKSWVVTSTRGLEYQNVQLSINGDTVPNGQGDGYWWATRNGTTITNGPLFAGDIITIDHTQTMRGQTIRVTDLNANTIVLTLRG